MLALRSMKRQCLHRGLVLRVLGPSPKQWMSSSAVLWNTTTTSTEVKAATETQDIKVLDSLLKLVS